MNVFARVGTTLMLAAALGWALSFGTQVPARADMTVIKGRLISVDIVNRDARRELLAAHLTISANGSGTTPWIPAWLLDPGEAETFIGQWVNVGIGSNGFVYEFIAGSRTVLDYDTVAAARIRSKRKVEYVPLILFVLGASVLACSVMSTRRASA